MSGRVLHRNPQETAAVSHGTRGHLTAPTSTEKPANRFDRVWNGRGASIQKMRDPEIERVFNQILNGELPPKQANAAMRQVMGTLMVRQQALRIANEQFHQEFEQQKREDSASIHALNSGIRRTERSIAKTRVEISQHREDIARVEKRIAPLVIATATATGKATDLARKIKVLRDVSTAVGVVTVVAGVASIAVTGVRGVKGIKSAASLF